MTATQEEPDPFAILAAIAVRYGVPFEALMEEITGPSTLARLARDLLGLQDLERPPEKRGAKPRTAENWDLFVQVTLFMRDGDSAAVAIKKYLASRGSDARFYEATEQKFYRLKKIWGGVMIPDGLAALYTPPPETGD